jgi:hypothetical protein
VPTGHTRSAYRVLAGDRAHDDPDRAHDDPDRADTT